MKCRRIVRILGVKASSFHAQNPYNPTTLHSELPSQMIAMRVFQIVLATLLVAFARSTPTPSMSCGASSGAGGGSGNVFGIPSSSKSGLGTANPLHVRGGELYQPETIEEADALVLNAASNAQLVVIDFTASW